MTSSSRTRPLVKKEAPFQYTQKSGKNKNMVISPETKNDWTGWSSRWISPTQPVEANVFTLRKLTVALLVKAWPAFYATGNKVAHVVSFLQFLRLKCCMHFTHSCYMFLPFQIIPLLR